MLTFANEASGLTDVNVSKTFCLFPVQLKNFLKVVFRMVMSK